MLKDEIENSGSAILRPSEALQVEPQEEPFRTLRSCCRLSLQDVCKAK